MKLLANVIGWVMFVPIFLAHLYLIRKRRKTKVQAVLWLIAAAILIAA